VDRLIRSALIAPGAQAKASKSRVANAVRKTRIN
jgi:hypothetical protein